MRALSTIIAFYLIIVFSTGQSFVPVGFDIQGALGVETTGNYVWLVAGGTGANDGHIIRYDEAFTSEIIVAGLPSFFDSENQALESSLNTYFIDEDQFYVIIGGGPGPDFGALALFSLEDYNIKGAPLTLADANDIIPISEWALAQGYAESNPYAILPLDNGDLLISDAASNAIFRYSEGTLSVFADIPSTANPLPFGPPMMEPVPTQILAHPEGGYLVSTFTGFPFASGGANIYHLTEEGEITTYATGLTLLTDMAYDLDGSLLALQFANFGEMGFEFGSAQLLKVSTEGSHEVLASGFGASAGFDIAANGNIYASHLFLGQLLELERCLVDGGTLSVPSGRDAIEVCVGDGRPDKVSFLTDDVMGESSFVITDENGYVLGVSPDNEINFENAGSGLCHVYNVATVEGVAPDLGSSIADLDGCVSISNFITVNRLECEGCHTPINLRYRKNSRGQISVYWDRVRDALWYELLIVDQTGNEFRVPATRRKVRITGANNCGLSVSVRAICDQGQSDYSAPVVFNCGESDGTLASLRSTSSENNDFEEIDLSKKDIIAFPNPVSDRLIIQLQSHNHEGGVIDLIHLDGRIVRSIPFAPGDSQKILNVSDLQQGFLFAKIAFKGGRSNQELISIVR